MSNLIHNRRALLGLALVILVAVVVTLIAVYSGGGHAGVGGY